MPSKLPIIGTLRISVALKKSNIATTIQDQNQELYECKECGLKYAEKGWAEKCQAWCRQHNSCNLEITLHAAQGNEKASAKPSAKVVSQRNNIIFFTRLFYGLIGVVASLAFFLLLYWSLLFSSSNITMLISNTYDKQLYFWLYFLLTVATIILFGINASLFVYQWRKFGRPRIIKQGSTGMGSIVGVAASACPVCGSILLSAIGIAGGLAALPFRGLELKVFSMLLLALPIWLAVKDMKKIKIDCKKGLCPTPRDTSFKKDDRSWLLLLMITVIILSFIGWNMLRAEPIIANVFSRNIEFSNATASQDSNKIVREITEKVLPSDGFKSKIKLGDSVVKLVQNGVIDRNKFLAIYQGGTGFPVELKDALDKPSPKSIILTSQNANYYVNLLWPIGLSNYLSSNKQSPINGKYLFNLASTGGWNLGKEQNGGAYFNKFKIVELTQEQEALAVKIAQNTYRPCCNNSTFYQDCNHGSALLGLLELGASQGLNEDQLYREALAFNSFWFPQNYIETALYFKEVKNVDWENVDPKVVMSKDFSTLSGWSTAVAKKVEDLGLLPKQENGSKCGV